jgi:site-specific DNA-cytosine methylase
VICMELFSCAGGMAEGFRRAGVHFDMAVDFTEDHCASYERNLGYRPVRMDARDLLRMVKLGWRVEVDLFVADPPCTPWSRAGKRLGTADERDMLEVTCDLIAALRPRRYLIGNVPGLDDSNNWHIVQRVIGGLSKHGYCVADFAALDAADYGVPQHRIRPFWFGHLAGPCIRWPAPTHGDPAKMGTGTLPGIEALAPWVTCREALGHLSGEDLGRPVRLRRRAQNSPQHGSVPDRPARVVGTSNLSDGNVIVPSHHMSDVDAPARAITTQCRSAGHATTLVFDDHHRPSFADEPAMTVRAGNGAGARRSISFNARHQPSQPSQPSQTIGARSRGNGSSVLEWPWNRPATTVTARPGLAPPGHHDENFAIMSLPDAVQISERAAAILQGFPESWVFIGETKRARWSQIGQAMPPALAAAVASSVVEQNESAKCGAA